MDVWTRSRESYNPMTDKYDLELLMQGHAPILYIESHEETRAKGLLVSIATKLIIPIFQWSAT
jgi:hypothetical protein